MSFLATVFFLLREVTKDLKKTIIKAQVNFSTSQRFSFPDVADDPACTQLQGCRSGAVKRKPCAFSERRQGHLVTRETCVLHSIHSVPSFRPTFHKPMRTCSGHQDWHGQLLAQGCIWLSLMMFTLLELCMVLSKAFACRDGSTKEKGCLDL